MVRCYNASLTRHWTFDDEQGGRTGLTHPRTGERARVAALAEALTWITARVAGQRDGTLQRHKVVRGYQDAVCAGQGKATSCYGPLDTVKYGQVMLFLARAMVVKGYWVLQPDDRTVFPDQNGAPGVDPATDQQTRDHRMVVTYVRYTGAAPDVASARADSRVETPDGPRGWGDAAPRAWFARAFWPALDSHFGK